jgi:hypothetical protein
MSAADLARDWRQLNHLMAFRTGACEISAPRSQGE